ncbi:hypothetical protein C0992_013037, partial [Termitomyces sp. T32_za158]
EISPLRAKRLEVLLANSFAVSGLPVSAGTLSLHPRDFLFLDVVIVSDAVKGVFPSVITAFAPSVPTSTGMEIRCPFSELLSTTS